MWSSKLQTVQKSSTEQSSKLFEVEELNVSSALTCVALTMLPTTLMLELEALWIADTGATSHVTKYATGGINRHDTAIKMKGCMNNSMTTSFEMDIPVTYCHKDGNKIRSAELKDVQVNNRFNFNLFSITRMLAKGLKLKGDNKSISKFKGACSFEFDTVIHTKQGALYCARMKRKLVNNYSEVTNASVSDEMPVKQNLKTSMKRAHKCFGHLREMMTCAAAAHLGMTLSRGALPVCESCEMAKAHRHYMPKDVSDDNKALKFNGSKFQMNSRESRLPTLTGILWWMRHPNSSAASFLRQREV